MLRIRNLCKSYAKSGKFAVNNLSIELRPGEIFGFLGPNGAGKTTTIKAVSGILSFENGLIEICGHNIVTDSKAAKMNTGYVSDSHILFEKLTGREYVNFLADVYGVNLEDRKIRSEKMLEIFSLTSAYDSQIRTYSHGMKQKINIIGAMIHNPKLWILDEPLTGLDPQSAYQLKLLMRQHCNGGNTVFFSTHVLEVAEKICDRIGIIVNGELVMVGDMKEIKKAATDKSLEEIFLSLVGEEFKIAEPQKPEQEHNINAGEKNDIFDISSQERRG